MKSVHHIKLLFLVSFTCRFYGILIHLRVEVCIAHVHNETASSENLNHTETPTFLTKDVTHVLFAKKPIIHNEIDVVFLQTPFTTSVTVG